MNFLKVKNISDTDFEFTFNSTLFKVKAGEEVNLPEEIALHGIKRGIVQQDFTTQEFISRLVKVVDVTPETPKVEMANIKTRDFGAKTFVEVKDAASVMTVSTGKEG